MGLFDMDFSNTFYDDSSWDSGYDSSFDLSGVTNNDTSYWKTAWDIANTPTGQGLINGAAQGLSSYLEQDSKEGIANKDRAVAQDSVNTTKEALADKINTRAAHNESINKPYSGAKDVKYNGVAPTKTNLISGIQGLFADKFK